MKKLTAILLIVAMMLTLGACSKKSDDADDSIKIGVMSTRTGENSLWGDVIYQTVQLLADDVNENGGLLGGRKIEILSYDNRDDVVETTNVARKAILNDGVCAFIGCEASATTIALVDVATEYKVPVISTMATNTKVTMTDDGKVRPYGFRACLSDPQSGTILGQYTVEKLGYKNVAIIYEIGSDFSLGVSGQYAAAVEAAGGTVVAKEAYNTGDVDYRAVLTKIKESGDFDCLYIAAGYYKQIGLIANQARELGITQPLLSTEGTMSGGIFEIAGDNVNGIIFNVACVTKAPGVDELLEKFIARWGYDPSIDAAPDCYMACDAFKLLTGAIEKAGSTDSVAIRDALETTKDLQGLTCTITIDPATHNVYRQVPIYQIVDGEFKQLELYDLHA